MGSNGRERGSQGQEGGLVADTARLLTAVADALNACEQAGLKVKLKHGIVTTRHGYVLPVRSAWAARTLGYTAFSGDGKEDDDD